MGDDRNAVCEAQQPYPKPLQPALADDSCILFGGQCLKENNACWDLVVLSALGPPALDRRDDRGSFFFPRRAVSAVAGHTCQTQKAAQTAGTGRRAGPAPYCTACHRARRIGPDKKQGSHSSVC